jgi:hypothetical protein
MMLKKRLISNSESEILKLFIVDVLTDNLEKYY